MNSLPPAQATELDNDDRLLGRFLSRREMLTLLGAGGVAVVAAACLPGGNATSSPQGSQAAGTPGASQAPGPSATPAASAAASLTGEVPTCVVVPELTEGPYYIDTDLDRSDIRPDTTTGETSEGVPLALTFAVARLESGACSPIEGAVVDLWHCDALGVYSGVSGNSGNFLRGVQRTDANGLATFQTVYPGWYRGRAVHMHFKVRTDPDAPNGYELTSQLFLDDDLSRGIYGSTEPYSQKGEQGQTNDSDSIFRGSGGTTLLDAQPAGDGYAATFAIGLQIA